MFADPKGPKMKVGGSCIFFITRKGPSQARVSTDSFHDGLRSGLPNGCYVMSRATSHSTDVAWRYI